MGLLVNGKWENQWYDTKSTNAKFKRQVSSFRNWIFESSSASPGNNNRYSAEPNRYHLFVSLACPWAHRTLIMRSIKQLENIISITIVEPDMLENGWEFSKNDPSLNNLGFKFCYLYQVYQAANPTYTGRVTVPVIWDKKDQTIVNNESSEIIRILNSSFNDVTDVKFDFFPKQYQKEIDEINAMVYENINNGVYRCGFATTQAAYEKAFDHLFKALDQLDSRLGNQRFLVGNQITEADIRLFTTLVRFDAVYYSHFKTNRQRISDYKNLSNYLRDLYQIPEIQKTVNFYHIKRHYYFSHPMINTTQIVPKGPDIDLDATHDRDRFDSTLNF